MRWLWLHDNPGAPFPLTVNLVERDVPATRAPYIARVAAKVATGTPFDMTVALSVAGGVEDPPTLSITGGTASSHETAVITRVGAVPVRVGIVAPPPLPTHRCGGQPCFKGLATSVGKPLRLFDAEPTVTEQIANQEIGPDGDAVTLHLARHFSDPDSVSLAYVATSSDPAVATVTVAGETATIRSVGELDGDELTHRMPGFTSWC